MSTTDSKLEVLPAEKSQFALVKFNVTDATIAKMSEEYLALFANGVEDKEGYSGVHEAHMLVKACVSGVRETHKRLKAPVIEHGKKVDAEKDRLLEALAPIAAHLKGQKDVVNTEKARIRAGKAAEAAKVLDDRMAQLAAVEAQIPPSEVEAMDIEEFEATLETERMHYEERVAEEEAAAKAEAEARAAEEAEAKARAAELKAKEDALAKERREFEEEKAAARVAEEAAEGEPEPEPETEPTPDAPEEVEARDILKAIAVSLSEIKIPFELGPEIGEKVVEIMVTAASDVLKLGEDD